MITDAKAALKRTSAMIRPAKYDSVPSSGSDAAEADAPPRGWCNVQSATFVLSLLAQLGTMILSFFVLSKGGLPDILSLVLILETVVQVVELVWYSVIGLCVIGPCAASFSPGWRYFDWLITTPTMLWSLYLLIIFWKSRCQTYEDLWDVENIWWGFAAILIADWCMLLCGSFLEVAFFRKFNGYGAWPILPGFLFLVAAFVPHLVTLHSHYSEEGLGLTLATLAVWMFYGLVAIGYRGQSKGAMAARNSCYNILDIISKNSTGVIISIVALNFDSEKVCPHG